MKRRTTIDDIAAEAGVSKAAVSYAMNGKPGVSAATRRRIVDIAARHNWLPAEQAKSASAASRVVGLVLPQLLDSPYTESYTLGLVSGLEGELRLSSTSLLIHVETSMQHELDIYRRWSAQGLVDAAVLCEVQSHDPRLELLHELELPAYVLGTPDGDEGGVRMLGDDAHAVRALFDALAAQGLRSFAHVRTGGASAISRRRAHLVDAELRARGLTNWGRYDSAAESDAMAFTLAIARASDRPDCIVFDSDLVAARGLRALVSAGVRVPGDISIAALDDSALCRYATPSVTAVERDAEAIGRALARLITPTSTGEPAPDEGRDAVIVHLRESTARPHRLTA